jgi:hypothetical protein
MVSVPSQTIHEQHLLENGPTLSVPAQLEIHTRQSSCQKPRAIEQVRRMRGGSQSHLMRCSDGNYYVVKFQNNPQHRRVLVNELLGSRLAERIGLPTTPSAVIQVSEQLIDATDELVMELPRYRVPCSAGKNFGSRYFGNPRNLQTWDVIPSEELRGIDNFNDLIGMVVFDKWTCNCDGRQLVFLLKENGKYSMVCIDQGFCFNSGEWNFPDSPLRGLYCDKTIYRDHVRSLDDFEPWLSRVEREFNIDVLHEVARDIPTQWYDNDSKALYSLLEKLDRRRKTIRELLRLSCVRLPLIFPNWTDDSRSCIHSSAAD